MSGGGFIPTDTEFHQVYVTEPCRRCDYKFHYPEGTPWNVVNDMVNNHWSVCPGSIRYVINLSAGVCEYEINVLTVYF